MSASIYLERDGKWEGPFTRDQLRDLLARGVVNLQTSCRVERDGKMQLRDVEFFTGSRVVSTDTTPKKNETEDVLSRPVPPIRLFAWILILGGIAGLVVFWTFDTGVDAGPGVRVNNLGLMQERQTGIIISSVVLIIGVLLALFAKRRAV